MRFRKVWACLTFFAALGGAAAAEAPKALIEGVWLTTSQSEMTVTSCVEGFCGFISKIVITDELVSKYGEQVRAIGTSFTDYNNKDPQLRNRPIQGLQVLTLRAGDHPWYFEGEIYNPEDGNVYAGSVTVTGPDTLMLKGCVLYVLCEEQEWTRIPPAP